MTMATAADAAVPSEAVHEAVNSEAVTGAGAALGTADDGVSGVGVEVSETFAVSAEKLWDVITDIARIGEFSPECKHAAWLDEARPGPRAGARFRARNEFGGGHTFEVPCQVIEAERPSGYAWMVLDRREDPEAPSSIWRYELLPGAAPGTTLVRHSFTHGLGDSGARKGAQDDPASFQERLATLRANMSVTLRAMVSAATAS